MASIITDARHAIWDSINNWDNLKDGNGKSVFKRQLKLDTRTDLTQDPIEATFGMADLPAIMVEVPIIQADWDSNVMQRWVLQFNVTFWTPHWELLTPEKYGVEIVRALYQARVGGATVQPIRQVTGLIQRPPGIAPARVTVGAEGSLKAMRTVVRVPLWANFDPNN